ncbi:hypothetical protein CVT25_014893 [Psilocybe cyanescens]|uniref:SnoaL-like domain-containing protein n=1 Tax=Psilocybe cyanescens TaxID=93625 RepID=A0A409WF39_PSICY|nr:hypothetical protein CVT25_014893 [Psilocybe cyanescens]
MIPLGNGIEVDSPIQPPKLLNHTLRSPVIMLAASQLQASTETFFDAFASEAPPIGMLAYFSHTSPAIVQHTPSSCPYPQASRLEGTNAIRSYFDLLATHWNRSDAKIRSPLQIDVDKRRVTLLADVIWTWKKSGRQWIEEFTWTLDYDEGFKIISFVIQTMSSPGTCVMRATDAEPTARQKFLALTQGSR